MNKINLPGKNINCKQNCQEKEVSFKLVSKLLEDNILINPPFQTDLDENKVEQMIQSYQNHPDYLIYSRACPAYTLSFAGYKNKIVIGVVIKDDMEPVLYVVDGQHRLQMAKQLYNENDINDSLIFCYFRIDNDKQMKRLFREINKDSFKSNKYVGLDDFKETTLSKERVLTLSEKSKDFLDNETIYDVCKNYLKEKYGIYFSEKKSSINKRYTINEFLNKLVENGYLESFEDVNELVKDIENKNKKFYKLIDYKEYYHENPNLFYKDEIGCVKNGFIFSLMKNNFIDYLRNPESVTPDHNFKFQKKTIAPKLRIQVWEKEFGDEDEGACPIYGCNNILNNGLNGFCCGHLVAEANGGETKLDNLRPICTLCNSKMATMDWKDYEKKVKRDMRQNKKKKEIEIEV